MNKELKKKILLSSIFVFLFLSGIVFSHFHSRKKYSSDFNKFNESLIDGVIKYEVSGSVSGTHLRVDSEKFTFIPYGNDIKFSYRAEVGDSVYKRPNSDTLWLKKSNKSYYYLFKKYSEDGYRK